MCTISGHFSEAMLICDKLQRNVKNDQTSIKFFMERDSSCIQKHFNQKRTEVAKETKRTACILIMPKLTSNVDSSKTLNHKKFIIKSACMIQYKLQK